MAALGLGPNGGDTSLDGVEIKLLPAPDQRVELAMIRVPETDRGQGVASKTLKHILTLADHYGVTLELSVWCSPEDGEEHYLEPLQLEEWYERHGFRYVGERDGYAIHVRPPHVSEEAMTIKGAQSSSGEIDRKKSERILDPQGFFKKAKAPYLKK